MNNLHFYADNLPPVLKTESSFDLGGYMILLDNYIIGSVMFLDKEFKQTTPDKAVYIPDPNWRLYPKDQFLTAKNVYPIDNAFTNYEYNGMFLFYAPNQSPDSRLYARSLRNHFENIHIKLRKQRIKLEDNKRRNIKIELERNKKTIKDYETKLKKLISSRDRDIRTYKRQGMSDSQINSILKNSEIENLNKEILRLKQLI
tara:strand:+ start:1731 stop:2333 length:603 start_codon:yes stop_codon:yes gene_type:complete